MPMELTPMLMELTVSPSDTPLDLTPSPRDLTLPPRDMPPTMDTDTTPMESNSSINIKPNKLLFMIAATDNCNIQ